MKICGYSDVMFDFNEAKNNARQEVQRIIEDDSELDESEVEEISFERENEWAWTFTAKIPKLIEEGWIPGAITVLIDKNDGHVWTEEEQSEFHKKWEKSRPKIGFIR